METRLHDLEDWRRSMEKWQAELLGAYKFLRLQLTLIGLVVSLMAGLLALQRFS